MDISSAIRRCLPVEPVKILVTDTSSDFQLLNAGAFEMYFAFSCDVPLQVRVGKEGIDAADDTDFLIPAGVSDWVIQPANGIRVIRYGADSGVLFVGYKAS